MRWWLALSVALGLALGGAIADLRLEGGSGVLFAVGYGAGHLLAVLAVRGPGLLAASVQPPVILLVALAVAEELAGPGGATSAAAVAIGAKATADFPLMLAVTGATVLLGLFRSWRARRRRSAAAF